MQEQTIFMEAMEIAQPAERAAFLDRACGGNSALRQRVEKLLQRHQQDDSFLASPAIAPPMTGDHTPDPAGQPTVTGLIEGPGTVIGAYKLLQQIGEGGMGTVYMAEQTRPVQRMVALKIIKPGMDSRQVIARFEAERQALALMDHPSIARVLDGGTTETGRPYFVMELVKGVPITKYCDERRLPPRVRLELFIQVCQAVQHAHQKGIIHRDLKPSNVLIALYDDKPVPKVIDFGIAKATGQKLTERTMFTEFGQVVGTLEYMSPEQAGLNQLDIDTRSDIYSLGVLLYELLTGSTPLERKRLKEAAMLEVLRLIREEEPPKPSTRLSATDEMPSVAANRGLEPKKLSGLVRGDLDWVVMKALEKDRNRRYDTANGFAADVQRYLADEPVLACPPSAGYRLRKFARRNKAGLSVTGFVLFFIVLLGGGVGWVVRDRQAQRVLVEMEITRVLKESRNWLDQDRLPEAAAAVARAETLLGTAKSSDALKLQVEQARRGVDLIKELEGITNRFGAATNFELNREHLSRFEKVFVNLGIDVDAESDDEVARRIQTHPLHMHLVAALDQWANARYNIARVEMQRGDAWWHRLLLIANQADGDAVRQRVRTAVLKDDLKTLDDLAASPDVARLPPATAFVLSRFLYRNNSPRRLEAAVTVLKQVRSRHPDHFGLNIALASSLGGPDLKRHEEALSYLRAAEAIRPQDVGFLIYLGHRLGQFGRADEAIPCFRKAVELDPANAAAHRGLGTGLLEQGKLDQAVAFLKKAIELDPRESVSHNNLGNAYKALNQTREAMNCYRKAIDLDPRNALAHFSLGAALQDQNDLDGAIASYRKAIELNSKYAKAHHGLGNALAGRGRLKEAIASYRKSIDLDPKNPGFHTDLGLALQEQKDLTGAIAAHRQAIAVAPNYALAHFNLGVALHGAKRLDEAIAAYRKSIALEPTRAKVYGNLGAALLAQKKRGEAVDHFRAAIKLDPKHAAIQKNIPQLNDLAWVLATSTDPKVREPARAVVLAEDVVRLAPTVGPYWYTLGVARYRVGNWKGALAALEKSMDLSKGPDAYDCLFLAMTHWQLGNKDEARKWYDNAAEWIEKNNPKIEQLSRFQSEAEELLGIKKK
jgi:serine/threonine protein kinase/tetratricopeptide (TPR) repeat protein